MKTAKSSIKKESTDLAKLKVAINATAAYINQWTEHEVNSLSIKNNMPYIYPIDKMGYIIGHFRILNRNNLWHVMIADRTINIFTEKLSAVFYVLCEVTKRFKLSSTILLADQEVTRLRNDLVHYEASVKRAKVNKDYTSYDIWLARLADANLRLRAAHEELRKSLNTAKYIKYWE